jgi:hypothetical protein
MERSKTNSHEDKALDSEGLRMPGRPLVVLTSHGMTSREYPHRFSAFHEIATHDNSYRALHLPSAMLFFQIRNQVNPTATPDENTRLEGASRYRCH